MSNRYETMYILRPDLAEENIEQSVTRFQTLLTEQGATDLETQHRGKRRLAYEIKKFKEGIYIQMNYTAPASAVADLEKSFRISEDVIRFLTHREGE